MVRGDFRAGANAEVYSRTELFPVDEYENSSGFLGEVGHVPRRYDIHPDGTRFLMSGGGAGSELFTTSTPIIVVTNWFEELKEKMGEK